ncbi:MAG TPA: serine/threonine protein phosphatase, partial [Acidimicrobiales bacterium]|nr:serine/threonine protein phosphatase [Acidimicrobiales bacterium]
LWRDQTLSQLTHDHTLMAELVRHGQLSEKEALEHPQRGVLTRALGVGPDVELDSAVHPTMAGDRFLLCTDGLFTEVPPEEIASLMADGGAIQTVADALVELALSRGGRDNVSVVVAEVSA